MMIAIGGINNNDDVIWARDFDIRSSTTFVDFFILRRVGIKNFEILEEF